jgi:hypothetical protein
MNKKYTYLFILLLLTSACERKVDDWQGDFLLETLFENNDKRLLNYDAVSENEKQIVWREEFDDNVSKWPIDTSIYTLVTGRSDYYSIFPKDEYHKTVSIEDGCLKVDYLRGESEFEIPFEIDESKNFEIEMKIFINDRILGRPHPKIINKFVTKEVTYQFFLYRYTLDEENGIDFVIESTAAQLFDWNAEDYLRINDFSIITIRKIGTKYAFFVNYELLYILNDNEFSCNKSYIIFNKGENMFDYVRVQYIND